jgi:hypothetical protein
MVSGSFEAVQMPVDSFHATSGGHKMVMTHEIHWIITIAPPRGNTMKFVKKPCLYSKYYPDFSAFTSAIEDCLAHTQTTHKHALSSLLALNFQSFKKAQSLTI